MKNKKGQEEIIITIAFFLFIIISGSYVIMSVVDSNSQKIQLCENHNLIYNGNDACLLKLTNGNVEKFCIEEYNKRFKLNEHPTTGEC